MSKQYYTDQEIIDGLKAQADESAGYNSELYTLLRETIKRIEQKQQQLDYMRERVDVAANLIGHNTISECMYEG